MTSPPALSVKRANVGYVLKSFPEPSETFIADEALSLYAYGLECCVLQVYEGDETVVHPSARSLSDRVGRYRLGAADRRSMLAALPVLARHSLLRTAKVLRKALVHPDRWCYFQALPAAAWCLRRQVTVLHAHFADVNLQYAAAIAEWTGLPFGVTTHRYDILDDPISAQAAGKLFREAKTVVTISEFNRRHMCAKYCLPAGSIHVVHCGIDLDRFAFRPDRPASDGVLRLVHVGRLSPIKAQDVLLEALAIIKQRGIRFKMDIIGGGPLREDLVHQRGRLDLSDEVIFHGMQTEGYVRQVVSEADRFVLSSRSEGLPVACIEALALGTPVIATRIFGIPELIEDGVSGWLAPPDDPNALADAICRAIAPDVDIDAVRLAGRRTVELGFSRGICTQQLAALWSDSSQPERW